MYIAFSIFVQSEYAFFDIFIGYSKRGHFGLHAKKKLVPKVFTVPGRERFSGKVFIPKFKVGRVWQRPTVTVGPKLVDKKYIK